MFSTLVALALIATAKTPHAPEFSEAAQKELKLFEGKWKTVKFIKNGRELNVEDDPLVEFEGPVMVTGKGFLIGEIVGLNPDAKVKTLDLQVPLRVKGEKPRPIVAPAIYKLDGDELTIALDAVADDEDSLRPTKFESAKRSGVLLVVLKRVK